MSYEKYHLIMKAFVVQLLSFDMDVLFPNLEQEKKTAFIKEL